MPHINTSRADVLKAAGIIKAAVRELTSARELAK
jgi:threonine aldolase